MIDVWANKLHVLQIKLSLEKPSSLVIGPGHGAESMKLCLGHFVYLHQLIVALITFVSDINLFVGLMASFVHFLVQMQVEEIKQQVETLLEPHVNDQQKIKIRPHQCED